MWKLRFKGKECINQRQYPNLSFFDSRAHVGSFIQQIFMKCLLCTSHLDMSMEKLHALMSLHSIGGDRQLIKLINQSIMQFARMIGALGIKRVEQPKRDQKCLEVGDSRLACN